MAGQRAIEADVKNASAAKQPRGDRHAPLKLEQFLPYQLNVVSSLVSQALSRVYSQRYGIGVPEWRVLVTLGQFEAMTAKAIGAHTHMHKTKVSRAVAQLEQRKLLGGERSQPRVMRAGAQRAGYDENFCGRH